MVKLRFSRLKGPLSLHHGRLFPWMKGALLTRRRGWQWFLLAVLGTLAAGLGYAGLEEYFAGLNEKRGRWDIAYHILCLFVVETGEVAGPVPLTLDIARLLAPVVAAWAVIKTFAILFGEQILLIRLLFWRDHVVVCGLGRKGARFAEDCLRKGLRVVGIEHDEANSAIRSCRRKGIPVLLGSATDAALLRKAGAHRARHVIAVCGPDGVNIETAVQVQRLVEERVTLVSSPVVCYVHLADLNLCAIFRQHGVLTEDEARFEARVFNVYEIAAREFLDRHPFENDWPVDRTVPSHLIIAGFGRMGEALALQAARIAHYAHGHSLRVTVIDLHAEDRKNAFLGAYPHFLDVCQTEFVIADAAGIKMAEHLTQLAARGDSALRVVVCLDDDADSLVTALRIVAQMRTEGIRVFARMFDTAGLAALVTRATQPSAWLSQVKPFGVIGEICSMDLLINAPTDTLARAFHQHYVADQSSKGKSSDDPSMQSWDRLDPGLKDSNRQLADHLPVKLRAINCYLAPLDSKTDADRVMKISAAEVELLARIEHERFVAERVLAGWSPGRKDPARRTSPHLKDWTRLPKKVKDIDRAFVAAIPELVARAGLGVYRVKGRKTAPSPRRSGTPHRAS